MNETVWNTVARFHVRLCQAAAAGCVSLAIWLPAGHAAEAPLTPVIVELFTSQGCSSCPPADAILRSFERNQPVADVVIVPLSEHVDYWNRLGWRDPFSSPRFSARQRAYGAALDLPGLYTPMMVVDGRTVLVGSDRDSAQRAIEEAGAHPKTTVHLDVDTIETSRVIDVAMSVGEPVPNSGRAVEIWLAVTEAGLVTDVMAGENMFRRLRHTGVVRHLERVATMAFADPLPTAPVTRRVQLDDAWDRSRLRVVVFLQDSATSAIVGAAATVVR